MNKCSISIQVFADFAKQLLAQDVKYKEFAEVAKLVIKRAGQTDAVKMVALKGLAKIYEQVAKKDTSFSFSADDVKVIDIDLEKDDLAVQFKKIAQQYEVRPTPTVSLDSIKSDIKQLAAGTDVVKTQDLVLKIIKDISTLARTNFRKSVEDASKTLVSLYDNAIDQVGKNASISPTIKTGLQNMLKSEKNKIDKTSSDYLPIKDTTYGDSKLIIRRDGSTVEVLVSNGKYFNVDNTDEEVSFDPKAGDKMSNLRVDSSPFVAGNDGTLYMFSNSELTNGMNLKDRSEGALTNQLIAMENPLGSVEVVVSREETVRNQKRIGRIRTEIPKRTLETYEAVSQQKALAAGNPVLTVFAPTEDGQIQFRIPGQPESLILYSLDNYAIVYPDNRTERVTFSEPQKELILKIARKKVIDENGNPVVAPLTEQDFYSLKAKYERFTEFKQSVQKILNENKDKSEVIIPNTLVAQYISLTRSGEAIATAKTASQQAPLEQVLESGRGQFTFNVVTAIDDVYSEPRVVTKPVIIAKQGDVWGIVTDLKSNDYVVVERESGPEYLSFSEYVEQELKLKTEITIPRFSSNFAWLYQKPDGSIQPIALKYAPTKQSADLARLAMSMGELIKNLENKDVENVIAIREFNIKTFGFNPHHAKDRTVFAADFDSFQDTLGRRSISIQLRPGSMKWASLAKDVRKALTIFIDPDVLYAFTGVMRKAALSDAFKALNQDLKTPAGRKVLSEFVDNDPQLRKQLTEAYDKLNSHVYQKYLAVADRLAKSSFNNEFDVPVVYTIMENEKSTLDGKWQMKVFDRTTGKDPGNLKNYRTFTTADVFKFSSLSAVFTVPSASAPELSIPAAPVTNPAVNTTGEDVPTGSPSLEIDMDYDDGVFELAFDAELFRAYQPGQFQQELDWIKQNLPSGITVEDLADILSDLKVEGRVLGYFRDRVIYLNEQLSSRGTGYHEAFHGVFRKLMDETNRRRYITLALGKMGAISKEQIAEFRQRRSLFHLSNQQVKDRMAEEYLADRFKAYKLEGRGAQEGWLKKLLNLIDNLIRFFNKNHKEIDGLFQRIDTGFYKNAQIVGEFKEGAFQMLLTRSTLYTAENGKAKPRRNYLNKTEQNQLINRLAELTSFALGETFDARFEAARKELIAELNIDNLIAQNPGKEEAIRARYESVLQDKLFTLGVPVSMINETGDPALDQNLAMFQADPKKLAGYNEEQQSAFKSLKQQVSQKLEKISITNMYFNPDAVLNEEGEFDDDDIGADETAFEDSFVNMNTLDGLSREFRSFFGLISYVYTDDLGVKTLRMVDGVGVFDTMMKILADTPTEDMMNRMQEVVKKLGESDPNSPAYLRLNAVWEKMRNVIFKLNDNNQPTRNFNLYNQFIDTFNVADLATDVFHITTGNNSSKFSVKEATIQNDINQYYEKLRRKYEMGFMKKPVSQREELIANAKKTIKTLVTGVSDLGSQNMSTIKTKAKTLHKALSDIGIVVPLHTIVYSLVAIDVSENNIELKPDSKAMKLFLLDQDLIKTGAYLQKDFFDKIVKYLDADTDLFDQSFDTGSGDEGMAGLTEEQKFAKRNKKVGLDLINSVLKKTGRYVVKYDMDTVVSVFRNAEGKNVYRYVRYTPPLLISQSLRKLGWQKTYEQFPAVHRFLQDNPLTAKTPEMQLYLKNLELRMFGGARQTLKGVEKDGATAKTIDTAGYYLSYILMSMNRKTVTDGKVTITTFNRMLTQNEGSSTIYTVPNLYKKMVNKEGYLSENGELLVVKGFLDNINQEYNRIQREWRSRNTNKELYAEYNAVNNPDGSANTEAASLRAYKFNMLPDFFEFNLQPGQTKNPRRAALRDALIAKAKEGVPFSKLDVTELKDQLISYAEEKFEVHLNLLKKFSVVTEDEETGDVSSSLIPETYMVNGSRNAVSIESEDSDLRSYLKDVYFNVYLNNLQVSQFFDGDIAMGVKSFANYFKRQKMNVASGSNMHEGNHTVAYIDTLSVFIDKSDLELGQYDENDEMPTGFSGQKVDVFDGQSVTTIEHRIEQYRKQGRQDQNLSSGMSVEGILKASRYRKITEEEAVYLKSNKVVLGPKKTVTGALIHYHKQAEHILFRTDSSYLVVPKGMTRSEVEKKLADLYNQADLIRQRLRNGDLYSINEAGEVVDPQDQLKQIFTEVHRYWEPYPHRSAHHFLLNSMELYDIDQLMDPTASKKATLLPVKVSTTGVTDLSKSKLIVSNKYKFDQVETSKVSTDITSTTQLLHLIDADINMSDRRLDSMLKDAIKEYRKLIGRLSEVSLDRLNNIIITEEGEVDVRVIIRSMRDGLEAQGADSNTLKFFEIKDDQPVHNINLPLIKKMFTYYYFSFYSSNVFNKRQSGRKDYIVTSWGYKIIEDRATGKIIKSDEIAKDPKKYNDASKYKLRYPGFKYDAENDRYVVEVIVPRPFFKSQEEVELFERKLSLWMSTRIPTEDKRSMMVAKVVDFMDGSYQNAIVVPQLIHILSGSDLDIDSLYSHTFATYRDFNDKLRVYGEANTPQEQFVEYLQSMMEDESLAPLVKAELTKVYKEQITEVPESIVDMAEDLNLPYFNYTKEQWIATLEELRQQHNDIIKQTQTTKERRQQTQDIYEKLKAENEQMVEEITTALRKSLADQGIKPTADEFAELLWEQTAVMKERFREQGDLRGALMTMTAVIKQNYEIISKTGARINDSRAEIKRIGRLMKLLATLNVMARKRMPVTKETYYKATKNKGSLVVETIQNDLLQAKIDILGNPHTFKNLYVAERSDVSKFEKLAEAMGKTTKDVVNRNNIFSPDGIIGSRDMVTSSNSGIGIAANVNKFAAFASKNKLRLFGPIWSVNGKDYIDFESDSTARPISDIGNILGMQTDAKSNPVPAVLNLNEVNLSTTLVMIAQKLPMEMAIGINSVPLIMNIVNKVVEEKRNIRTLEDQYKVRSFSDISKSAFYEAIEELKEADLESELFQMTKEKQIQYDNSGMPVFKQDLMLEFDFKYEPMAERTTAKSLGFVLKNGMGMELSDLSTQIYLLDRYINNSKLNSDVLSLGSIFNLYKKLKPSWNAVDRVLENYNYMLGLSSRKPMFSNIKEILESSMEFKPLIKAVKELSKNAESVFIERHPVIDAVNKTIKGSLQTWNFNETVQERISDLITKFFIINKFRVDTETRLQKELAIENPKKLTVQALTDALEMFKADFWKGEPANPSVNSLDSDFDYLKNNYEGNPFVDFLKERVRQGITLVEALSRMKLEVDLSESISDGYVLLESSPDERTKLIARKFFNYILIKDGLGYGTNTFINYLNPSNTETFVKISSFLNVLQKELTVFNKKNRVFAEKGKDEIYYKRFATLLNNYFDKKADLNIYISALINRIGLHAGNNDIMVKSRSAKVEGKKSRLLEKFDTNTIKTEIAKLLPETHALKAVEVYPELKDNPESIDLWIPTSKEIGVGTVVINTTLSTGSVGSALISQMSIRSAPPLQNKDGDQTDMYVFPLFVKNTFGTVLRLTNVDNVRVSDKILKNLTAKLQGKPYNTEVIGMQAVYTVAEQEGSYHVLNLGFDEAEAREIFKFTQQESDNQYLDITLTAKFEEAMQRLRNTYNVDSKRLAMLTRIIKSEIINKGGIMFEKQKNNLFFLDYTVDVAGRGPVQRKIFFRPSPTSPLNMTLDIREREVITGIETVVELTSELKDFKAADVEFLSKGKLGKRKTQVQTQATASASVMDEMLDDLVKNYKIPQGYKLNTDVTFEMFVKNIKMTAKGFFKIENLESVYNKQNLVPDGTQPTAPAPVTSAPVTPAASSISDLSVEGYVVKPGATSWQEWLPMMRKISNNTIEELMEKYIRINMIKTSGGEIDDIRKDKDSGECIG